MICRNHVDVSEGVRRCSRCGGPFCNDCLVDISGRPYCATCKGEQLLDVRSGVDPQGMDYASIGRRFAAQFIDGLVIGVPVMVIFMVLIVGFVSASGPQSEPPVGIIAFFYIGLIFIPMIYEAMMLRARGQTLGKMAMKVRVVRADGSDLTAGQAWGRAGARVLLGFFVSILEYVPAFFTPDRKTLHDMIAGTRVVNWS